MGELPLSIVRTALDMAQHLAWTCGIWVALELLLPLAGRNSLSSRLRAVRFWLVYVAINATVLTTLGALVGGSGLHPLVVLRPAEPFAAWGGAAWLGGLFVAALLASLAGDFAYYWFHRLQHTSALLWRFHEVHHSIRELSALNAYHHVTEEAFRWPFTTLPLALLIQVDPGPTPWLLAAALALQNQIIHSSARLHLGPLRAVLADNRFHRIHHSVERRHWGRNFGAHWSLWDRLFGTAYMPARTEWPDTGVPGVPEPATVGRYLAHPFLRRPAPEDPPVGPLVAAPHRL